MSKYIRYDSANRINIFFIKTGMVLICLYLFTTFPGVQLFGTLPVQKYCLYLVIIHGMISLLISFISGHYWSKHLLWYGIFAIVSLLSLVLSGGSLGNEDFHSIIICLILTWIISLYLDNIRSFKCICWCYMLVSLINTLVLLFKNALVLDAGDRLGVELNISPNDIATYLMYGLIYALWLFSIEKGHNKRICILIIMIFITYPLILTGGRKFFLAPLIFLFVMMMMNTDSSGKSIRIRNICFILFIVIILWYLVVNIPVLYNSLGYRLEGLLNSFTGKGEIDLSAKIRGKLRQLAYKGWLEKPIWGYGFDIFKYYSVSNGLPFYYSHSNITELLFNGGIIQFFTYYWFFIMILRNCYKNKSINKTIKSFCIGGIVTQIFFDYGGVSYNLFHSQLFILMVFSMYNMKSTEMSTVSTEREHCLLKD